MHIGIGDDDRGVAALPFMLAVPRQALGETAVDNALKQATVYGDVSFLTPEFIKNITDIFIRALSFIKVVCS